jgi:hypothetical protein
LASPNIAIFTQYFLVADWSFFYSLVDVPECIASPFEILAEPLVGTEEPMYTRAYRVDDEGRDTLLNIARQHGQCSSCSSSMVSERYALVVRGFRAEVNGIVTNISSTEDGLPVQIQLLNASRSNDATVICGIEKAQVAPAPSPTAGGSMGSSASGMRVVSALVVLILFPMVLLL